MLIKSKFFFNGVEYTGFWNDYVGSPGPQTGFSTYDVTSILENGNNQAALQSFDPTTDDTSSYGDSMCVLGCILVTEYKPTVTADPIGGLYNHTLDVNLTASVTSTIYYTTNGDEPKLGSSVYSGPIHLDTTSTLKFMAVTASGIQTDIQSETYTIDTTAPDVTADPTTCLVNNSLDVTLTATETATIYYTTDGSDPTTSSNVYAGPIHLDTTTILKFMAVDSAGNHGPVTSETYTIDITAPTVNVDLDNGSFNTDQTITLTASDDRDLNPIIYYSTDGVNWDHQANTVTLTLDTEGVMNLRFYAVDDAGNKAANQTRTYILDKTAPTAGATPGTGTYNTPQSVVLSANDNLDTTPVIYYTTDGSDPTTSSNVYSAPLTINSTTKLKFMAVDAAGNPSEVYTVNYTIPNTDVYVNTSVSNNNPNVGDIITMTFKIGNNGPDNAAGVVFTYVIPGSFEYVMMYVGADAAGFSAPTYNSLTRTVTWNLGDLSVCDPTLYLVLKVLSSGSFTITPSITTTTYDPVSGNNEPELTINVQESSSNVNAATASNVNAAESTSETTVPMQETGAPFAGLIVGILSLIGGFGISREGKGRKLPFLLLMGIVFSLAICGTATADPYVGGDPPVTVQNGTVSGGLYEDTY
jgi:acyl-CoA hydrolase